MLGLCQGGSGITQQSPPEWRRGAHSSKLAVVIPAAARLCSLLEPGCLGMT